MEVLRSFAQQYIFQSTIGFQHSKKSAIWCLNALYEYTNLLSPWMNEKYQYNHFSNNNFCNIHGKKQNEICLSDMYGVDGVFRPG